MSVYEREVEEFQTRGPISSDVDAVFNLEDRGLKEDERRAEVTRFVGR